MLLKRGSLQRRFNVTALLSRSEPKSFKPSAFAFPSDPKTTPLPSSSSVVSSVKQQQDNDRVREDIAGGNMSDFQATRLIHGDTKKTIAITERALNKLNKIHTADPKDSALHIQVESGGCHGFQYNLNLVDLDKFLAENKDEDVFVFERDDGERKGRIVLDDSSLTILQDSKVDHTKELIGSQFKVVDSPYTSTSCGCGASFDFDFEKLERKQEEN
ncbi:ISA2 [Candida oxycetoniae]|uniref:ISA2 n=1 Tax=Candida oxycetoniae TaxID=497107 RepID=A0AAI9SUM2_9ASCO|nr:ISA2 [Candida oxycetoniae]KAI3402819.2 ISA2 [Candida oxycetoniae]